MTAHMNIKHGEEKRDEIDARSRARRNEINARRRAKTLAVRLEKDRHAVGDSIDAYWADKPYYTTRDEFIEFCKAERLTEQRTEEMRERWAEQRGSDVAAQTCMTYMCHMLRSPGSGTLALRVSNGIQICLSARVCCGVFVSSWTNTIPHSNLRVTLYVWMEWLSQR